MEFIIVKLKIIIIIKLNALNKLIPTHLLHIIMDYIYKNFQIAKPDYLLVKALKNKLLYLILIPKTTLLIK